MMQTEFGAQELSRAECLSLLPHASFGRLVFTDGALPAVMIVNFALDPAGIVIRTRAGSSLCRSVDSAVVAFQADDVDVERRSGWSVTVVGAVTAVTSPVAVARLSQLPLHPWVGGQRDAFLLVALGIVSGRRIGGPAVLLPPARHAARC